MCLLPLYDETQIDRRIEFCVPLSLILRPHLFFFLFFFFSFPIIFIRRFHHRNMILTLNVCFAVILSSFYWLIYYTILNFSILLMFAILRKSCVLMTIISTFVTIQVPFSLVTASINRCFSVVYFNKHLFKTKKWVLICIVTQWIFGFLVILPISVGTLPVNLFFERHIK